MMGQTITVGMKVRLLTGVQNVDVKAIDRYLQ